MIPHNIFENSEVHHSNWDNSTSAELREGNYVQLTPISPIKMSSYATSNQETPQFEAETTIAINDDFVIEQIIDLLQSESDIVSFEAASSMLQLITNETAKKIVELDGIFCLSKALNSSDEVVRDECAKCLCKLACVSSTIRDNIILDEGLISLLNSTMSDNSRSLVIQAVSECFNDKTRLSSKACEALIPQLANLLNNDCNEFVVNEICNGIVYISTGNNEYVKAFIDHGTKTRLTHLLTHQSDMVVTAALRAIRCLVLPKIRSDQDRPSNSRDHNAHERSPLNTSNCTSKCNVVGEGLVGKRALSSYVTNQSPSRVMISSKNVDKEASSKELTNTGSTPERHGVWLISPLTSVSIEEQTRIDMCELDRLTCQNVEMFQATEEDANDREAEAGSARIGQVGLRCIHCGQSPFARAHFSTVYPGSIGLLPASLRHMAVKHFQNCETTPLETRKRMKDLCSSKESGLDKTVLKEFCTALCTRIGVANRQPHRSGLIVERSNMFSDDYGQVSTPCHPIVPISLFHPLSRPMNPNPIYDKSPWSPQPRHEQMSIEHFDTSFAPYYIQDQHGLWRCRDCGFTKHSAQIDCAIWRGTGPPPISFRLKHKNCCPHIHAKSVHGELPSTDPFLNTSAICQETKNHRLLSPTRPSYGLRQNGNLQLVYNSDKKDGVSKVNTSNDSLKPVIDHKKWALNTDLISPGDKEMISPYTFFAICQFKRCEFSPTIDSKRRGKVLRPVFKEKFAGLQCIHCVNGNQPRKFFFSKVERLSNNFSEMTSHVFKCKHCPPDIKYTLKTLKDSRQEQYNKLRRGSQKRFFHKLWEKIQGEQSISKIPKQSVSVRPKQSNSTAPKQSVSAGPMKSIPKSIPCCLAEPDDKEWFDEAECLARKGVQIFCATKYDVSFWKASIRKLNISVGQVGLRCLYCTRTDRNAVDLDATIFPSKIENIRDDVQLLYHRHSLKCKSAPQHIKNLLETVKATGSSFSKELNYRYVNWAKQFGLYNEKDGVVLYKQGGQKLDQPGDLLSLLESTIDQQSTMIEDILPEPPLEALLDDNMSACNNIANSCAVSVSPCHLVGTKRRHTETIQDAETIQQKTKKHCAV